ncbi:restriction endonuclease subunit S [Ruminococcus bicirculans]|nr:restriction endonuclease subunit S [Ruminococcus bicirculans (ex Wegman et al. 2014)]
MTAQQLKNSILQMAVQGKLVPQDPSDEPASVLLQRIKAEKQELIKAGKIKKDKKSSEIFRGATHNLPYAFCEQIGKEIRDISDEIPFEIPDSWEWCRIGSVFTLQAGKNISANQIAENVEEGLYPCFGGNGVRGYVPLFNREGYYPIIGRQGALCGNINLAKGQFYATEHAVCVETFANTNVLWCCYFLTALNLNQYATATAQPGLAVANINEVLIPLPPLSEQHRIVAKIEELLPYIERYGKAGEHLTALNTTFPEALKKSILQEAVQGKLVPQNPDDEPASVLLERIRAEKQALIKAGKIRKDKHESAIITRDKIPYEIIDGKERCIADEVPFEIPDSWCWCRLGSIIQIESGKGLTSKQMIEGSIPVYGGNGITGYHNASLVHKETVVIGRVGYYCGSVHITEKEAWVTDNAFITTYPENSIYREYLVYTLRYMNLGQNNNATAQPVVSGKKIYPMLFPLPPLAEQHRIVAKIEEIMPMIERLTLR